MKAAEARALLFQRKLAEVPVNVSLPDLAVLDDQLSILEMSGADTTSSRKLAQDSSGNIDDILAGAAMICRSLVLRETKERILSDTDVQAVAAWGSTVITPLVLLISQVSGFGDKAKETAKAIFLPMDVNDSSSSSAESLVVTPSTNGTSE